MPLFSTQVFLLLQQSFKNFIGAKYFYIRVIPRRFFFFYICIILGMIKWGFAFAGEVDSRVFLYQRFDQGIVLSVFAAFVLREIASE